MNKNILLRSLASTSLALMLAFTSSVGISQASVTAGTAPLTREALANAVYPVPTNLVASGEVQLKDGKYEDPQNHVAVMLVGPQAAGDLDGDGAPDSAVTLVANYGGSGVFSYLSAVLNDDGNAKPVDMVFLGDRVNVRRITIRRGQIAVLYLDRRNNQPMSARPTIPVIQRYKLSDDKLIALTPLTNAQLANATYPIEGGPEDGAQFVNGKYENADLRVTAELLPPRATGDLNGDGSPDSAVSMLVNTGGSGNFRYIAAVLNDQNQPVPVDTAFIGDRVLIRKVTIVNGVITVTYLDRRTGQPMTARPSVLARKQFKLEGDQLVEVGAKAAPAQAAPALSGVLTGTVTYLQRIALAPGAVVEVKLQDVSKADAPADIIASQTITTEGQQVPIAYELTYAPGVIDPKYTYTVMARITEGGKLTWISTQAYPVLTRGHPTTGVEIRVEQVGGAAPVEPTEAVTATETVTPAQTVTPTATATPAEVVTPTETIAPAETVTPTVEAAAEVVTPTAAVEASTAPTATVVEALASDPRFSALVSAVTAAGLDKTLSGEGPFTIFAPTNEAFAKLDQETLSVLLQNDMQQVIDVLLYHVAPGKYTAKETTESVEIDSALPGAKLGLTVGEGGITLNDKVLISQYDIPAANGVIHVIDTVQLPPMPVTTRLALDGRFRALVTAIKAAGLAETLDMQLTDYTLFAPTDTAFAKLSTGALDELIANPQALKDILAGHVVTPTLTAADVIKQNGKELPTLLAGVTLPISVTDGTVMVKDAKVIEPDVDFAGGVIHVIDSVLIPEAMPAEASAETQTFSGVLTGTVTYLQRSALDPRAQIVVQLQDVSQADAQAVVLAQQSILARGRQVPFAFTLNYDPASIDPAGRYAIQAGIVQDKKLLFLNTQAYLVLTGGNPQTGIEVVVEPVK